MGSKVRVTDSKVALKRLAVDQRSNITPLVNEALSDGHELQKKGQDIDYFCRFG
jgi:hypothetical protein